MKKRIFTIFLVIVLAITNIPISYADNYGGITDVNLFDPDGRDNEPEWKMDIIDDSLGEGTYDDALQTGSGIKKTIMEIIGFILNLPTMLIIGMVQATLPTMDKVIFLSDGVFTEVNFWGQLTRLAFFEPNDFYQNNNFASRMGGVVSAVYQTFRYVAILCFVVAISIIAVKMIMSSIGKQKQQYKEALKNWLLGLGLLVVGHWIMIYMIYFSEYLVKLIVQIRGVVVSGNIFGTDLTAIYIDAVNNTGANLINTFVNLIATIVFISMNLKIFKVYLERVIVVAVLIMLYPIITVFHVFEKSGLKRGATFNSWLNTFVSQVFIQPIHALSLMMVILMLGFGADIEFAGQSLFALPIFGPIIILMLLNFVFKIEDIVKRLFSINGASMGQPMRPAADVARLAKSAANTGISAYKIGSHMATKPKGDNLGRMGVFKDEMVEQLRGWGQRNGVNVAQLYDMNLNEAKNVDDKISNYLKTGKDVSESDLPEINRRLNKNGEKNELMARFGMTSAQWNEAIRGNLGDKQDVRDANKIKAKMVLAETLKPGSASKYIDDEGKIKAGFAGAFEFEMQGADAIKNEVKNLSKGHGNINAIKAALLQDPSKFDKIRDSGYVDKNMTNDEIIAGFDDHEVFSAAAIQAIAYSDTNNVPLKDLFRKDSEGNMYVAKTRMEEPMGNKSKKQVLENTVANGFRGSYDERQLAVSYAMDDEKYVKRIIDAEPDIEWEKADAWMNGAPDVNLNDTEKAAMGRVFAKIHADENPNNQNATTNAAFTSTASASTTSTTQTIKGTVMKKVQRSDGNKKGTTTVYLEPEVGADIESFATEAFEYAQTNGDVNIKFNDLVSSTANFNSPEEFVSAYNGANAEILMTDFAFGKEVTGGQINTIVGHLDTLETDFVQNHFGLSTDEFSQQLKSGPNKEELQEKLREEILKVPAKYENKASKNSTSGTTTHKVNVKIEGANVGTTAHVEPVSPNFDSSTIINEVTSKMGNANMGPTAHAEPTPSNTTVTHDVNVKMEGANVGTTAHVEPVAPNFDSSTIINEVTSKMGNANMGPTAHAEPTPSNTTVTHDVNVKMEGANVGTTAHVEPTPSNTTVTHNVNVTVENTGSDVQSAKEAYDNAMSGKSDTTVTHNINVTVEGGNTGTSSYTESRNVSNGTTQSTNTHEINMSVDDRRTTETTQNSFAQSLTSDFAFGREITNEEADIIVSNLDTIEEGFTEKHFNLNAEEFGKQLKFGENKAELQEALRRKLLEKK